MQVDKTAAGLAVTSFWPFVSRFQVFALDLKQYGYTLVAGPSHYYLWILARRPDLPIKIRNDLFDKAHVRGFPVKGPILVDHNVEACL